MSAAEVASNPGSSTSPESAGAPKPLVALCDCAGTIAANTDMETLAGALAAHAEVMRDRAWCSREGRARLNELVSGGPPRRLVLAGCSADVASRRFRELFGLGGDIEVADIREGCSWAHGDDREKVTDKALRIVHATTRFPRRGGARGTPRGKRGAVLVLGGGIAGTQAAVKLAQVGHEVELVERAPFLGGRASRIGAIFPTNDCAACLPSTDDDRGVRRCFYRNAAIDHPNLRIWRRATVEAVSGGPGDFEVVLRQLPSFVTDDCIGCGLCEQACAVPGPGPGRKAIYGELVDGRVLRTVDLEACSFCGDCVQACPAGAIDLARAPELRTVHVGAVLVATGAEPAPTSLVEHLGYGSERVVTQSELAGLIEGWEQGAWSGRRPADEIVMVQCAGSRDLRRLPYCSRICCMVAIKHALKLRRLFPRMRVTICYLDLRAAGLGHENWYRAARRAGVEFLRGLPARVEFDDEGRPVVTVEDMAAAKRLVLHPDVVVLSAGLVPAPGTAELAGLMQLELDEDGFLAVLDPKNRPIETTAEGVYVCGSASGPKMLGECLAEAVAAAGEIHAYLSRPGRASAAAAGVDPGRCIGCGACVAACPFGAISLGPRAPGEAVPAVAGNGPVPVAGVRTLACRSCGICATACPERAIVHPLSDEELVGRIALLVEGAEDAVVGFVCAECAGAAFNLAGLQRDSYPEQVRLVSVPCLGRVSALHIVEAVRKGAAGVFLAGCAEGRCQYRRGDANASKQLELAQQLLAEAGEPVPTELWHLCAVDQHTVGRRLNDFWERARAARANGEPCACPA
jgi:heterodisulfide reductase subunit A